MVASSLATGEPTAAAAARGRFNRLAAAGGLVLFVIFVAGAGLWSRFFGTASPVPFIEQALLATSVADAEGLQTMAAALPEVRTPVPEASVPTVTVTVLAGFPSTVTLPRARVAVKTADLPLFTKSPRRLTEPRRTGVAREVVVKTSKVSSVELPPTTWPSRSRTATVWVAPDHPVRMLAGDMTLL